jgi:centrosomal protein CEP290
MKSERIFNSNEDQLQRKVKQLENELVDTKEELRKQVSLVEQRRNKNASDISLWDKQKRWQQTAEKLKLKLSERETEMEKLKSLNGSAKSTITRLEREKHILEQRIRGIRCCQSTSCPNLENAGSKYTPAESPAESYSTTSDSVSRNSVRNKQEFPENREMIESLKARVESQQRRIIAMELEGKVR